MDIRIETGVDGIKAISFIDGGTETFIGCSDGKAWKLASEVADMTLWDSCNVCTVDELWEALLKVAADKEWVPA